MEPKTIDQHPTNLDFSRTLRTTRSTPSDPSVGQGVRPSFVFYSSPLHYKGKLNSMVSSKLYLRLGKFLRKMKFKLFIFLALLFAVFLVSSAAVTEKSNDETKLDATEETNQVDDAKYGCKHRCCGHQGCRCCSYAEAQFMGAQAKDDKLEVAEEVNQVDQYGCRYRCCGHHGCRCCSFTEVMAEELNNQQNEVKYQGNGYGGGYGGGRGGGYGGGRGGGGYGGGGHGGGHGGGRRGGGGGHGGGRGGGGGGYGGEANP